MTIRNCVPAVALAAATVLAACSGGGGGNTARAPGTAPPPASTTFDRNQAVAYGASQPANARSIGSLEPTNTDPTGRIAVIGGVNQTTMLRHIQRGCTPQRCYPSSLRTRHESAEIGHLRLRDGVSAVELLRYLRADARDNNGLVQRWGATPPVVRMIEGASDRDKSETFMAVRLINSALPADWQVRFDHITPAAHDGQLTPGVIEVAFAPRERWGRLASGGCENAVGCAAFNTVSGRVTEAVAVVDPTRVTGERKRVFVLLHELLHALGRGHVSPAAFPDTIMHTAGDHGISEWLILNRLDEAALHAVYDRLSAGQSGGDLDMNDFGPWSDVSTHVYARIGYIPGRFDAVTFGAVWQNRNVRPYAIALGPSPPLANGPRTGSATWSGRLAGLTPQAEAVAGAADMTVQLSTLRGALDFTGLEHWAAHAAPGVIGTGTQWRDGDLNYRIAVNGRVFYETGGDAGKVTGIFYGSNQQKIGGTLRRTDLAAGFGAQRR